MNIYVRKNNNDFLKFLTKDEIDSFPCQSEIKEYRPQENILIKGGTVNLVTRGLVNIISQKTKRIIMTLSEGEMFGEEMLFQAEWSLICQCETQTVIQQYAVDLSNMQIDNVILSKIHAAINDSLAEKLIRLTQDSVREENNEIS